MKIEETTIKDLKIISPKVHSDSRGFFETFSLRWFVENIEKVDFVQDNHSRSSLGH